MASSENYVSPYLLRPLRSYEECLHERAQKKLLRECRACRPVEGERVAKREIADDRS